MKGMMDFLERAGLVRQETPEVPATASPEPVGSEPLAPTRPVSEAASPAAHTTGGQANGAAADAAPINLEEIYANQGIAPSFYPAERLLRLIDGLSAMDGATRLMAIRAMDAADESWTIADPLADAAAKTRALTTHAALLQSNLQQLERRTEDQLAGIAQRKEQVLAGIRKQMSELEALVARETARADKETSAQQAQLQAAQNRTAAELAELSKVTQRLQGLASQFGAAITTAKE